MTEMVTIPKDEYERLCAAERVAQRLREVEDEVAAGNVIRVR